MADAVRPPATKVTDAARGIGASTAEKLAEEGHDVAVLDLDDAECAEAVAPIPVGRAYEPADIAHSVPFFIDERSGFVSGQVLYVAGGPRT